MTNTKAQPAAIEPRYRPARELAARATSKHGNPADHAIVCSTNVSSSADVVAARVYSAASGLDGRSQRGDVSLRVGPGAGGVAVIINVAPPGEALLDRGGFALRFAPHGSRDAFPRFEGQVRIDNVDIAHSRIVVEGRYIGGLPSPDDTLTRTAAEDALRQVVGLLTASFRVN